MGRAKNLAADKAVGYQVGALCWRVQAGKVQILMITSRTTKRWIVPKGWTMPGHDAPAAAAIEAWEEAGVRGRPSAAPIDSYRYLKIGDRHTPDIPCRVDVYPLKVTALENEWPEKDERRRRWMSRKKAAARVWEPALARMIKRFDPKTK